MMATSNAVSGVHDAVCSVWTHPDGAELRLMIDGKLRTSDASYHVWVFAIVAWLDGAAAVVARVELITGGARSVSVAAKMPGARASPNARGGRCSEPTGTVTREAYLTGLAATGEIGPLSGVMVERWWPVLMFLSPLFATYQHQRSQDFVALLDDEVVGGAGVAPLNGTDPLTCELHRMCLRRDARGRGSGNALLERCLNAARPFLYVRCYPGTITHMKPALDFCSRNGFRDGWAAPVTSYNDRWLMRPRRSAREPMVLIRRDVPRPSTYSYPVSMSHSDSAQDRCTSLKHTGCCANRSARACRCDHAACTARSWTCHHPRRSR